ncbi:MAG: NTPase [Candidatus Hadarchaeum sp.]|uniref:NTPase n=1 Tax=Candidatus Hadarchaeum sp. TaxID=2883567 RepID=UPI003D0E50A5
MPNNFLVTGPPSSGKTTVVERAVALLRERGLRAGGIYCPEIRERGIRVGFKMIDLMTGEERILAHVDQPVGPQVSRYRVNVSNVDELSQAAIGRALREADLVVIDEIAPMELHSMGFRRAVLSALDSPKPLLAVIHQRTTTGFIGEVKSRADVKIYAVTQENRIELPKVLADAVLDSLTKTEKRTPWRWPYFEDLRWLQKQ